MLVDSGNSACAECVGSRKEVEVFQAWSQEAKVGEVLRELYHITTRGVGRRSRWPGRVHVGARTRGEDALGDLVSKLLVDRGKLARRCHTCDVPTFVFLVYANLNRDLCCPPLRRRLARQVMMKKTALFGSIATELRIRTINGRARPSSPP